MKAILSCTRDPLYSFFVPITTWCWNKLGVDVILFVPGKTDAPLWFAMQEINKDYSNRNLSYGFNCPQNKEATYAQCSRLYAAALDLQEQEILCTSDVDMLVFEYPIWNNTKFYIYGVDLVPPAQYPMCYILATVKKWRQAFNINGRTYQKCLDDLVGVIECQDFRGCQWSLDQDTAFKHLQYEDKVIINRAYPNTQFATKREDRDSWGNVNRIDLFDAHLPRPGFTDQNFEKILNLLQYKYPNDSFEWLINYRNEYIKLL